MIVLVTDFGLAGPYTGQLKAVLYCHAPTVPVIDLFADIPCYDIKAAAYLLAAFMDRFPQSTVFLCVVDPGVGSDSREPIVLQVDGRWFVGPDNGLFDCVVQQGDTVRCWRISWRPENLSTTFHGRDLFAPVAASLAMGDAPPGEPYPDARCLNGDCGKDYPVIIYIDHFGNAMTGIRAATLADQAGIVVAGVKLNYASTFSGVARGQAFWYRNSNGLVEIAVNQGSAARQLGLKTGQQITLAGEFE